MIVLRTGANRGSFTTFTVNWSGHSAAADQTTRVRAEHFRSRGREDHAGKRLSISGVLLVSFLFSSDMKTALSRPLL